MYQLSSLNSIESFNPTSNRVILADFAALLRQCKICISVAEVLDAQKAIDEEDIWQIGRESLRSTLSLTMLKRHQDKAMFDFCFDRFFSSSSLRLSNSSEVDLAATESSAASDFVQMIDPEYSKIGSDILTNQLESAAKAIAGKSISGQRSAAGVARKLRKIEKSLYQSLRMGFRGSKDPLDESVRRVLEERIALSIEGALKEMLRSGPFKLSFELLEIIRTSPDGKMDPDILLDLDFMNLQGDLEELKQQLILLGKKIAIREIRRRRKATC